MKYLGFKITKEKQKLDDRVWDLYTAKDLYSDYGYEIVFQSSEKNLIKYKIEDYWVNQINKDKIVPKTIIKSLEKNRKY